MFVAETTIRFRMQKPKQLLFIILMAFACLHGFSQPNTSVDLDKDKPKEYSNRKLGSEKTGEKKFTLPRRITQNTYTHYNYYFNANNKLNEVIARAKSSTKDDYTQLLPFYPYNLDATAREKGDLDSIIYKCTAGILLHDLRNDWIDNLYILLGRAYLLRKDFDSATGCFQYVNYTYAPKDDGYDIPLGSNASGTKGVFTISTNEKKRSFIKKITSRPPSRNESFIWQARNYLEQDQLAEAAGLLNILRNDPLFPKRLQTDLHEMIAYLFYKQQTFDSSAWHLQKALDNADGKNDQARWEFLAGQLYQAAKKDSLAIKLFEKSIQHTYDPLMEVYARLNIVSLASASKKDALQQNLNELIKLAKRDKYADYRDIIYYAAALLELKRNGFDAAQNDLLKSVKNSAEPKQKSLSFLLLGDLNYDRNQFVLAHHFYDSVQIESTKGIAATDKERLDTRKPALKTIATNLGIIQLNDSLQKVAAMPVEERTAYIKKLLKRLRKEQGLKGSEEDSPSNNSTPVLGKETDLFASSKDGGDFYFSNAALRSKGFTEFKSRWGRRTNVDNWRRQQALEKIPTVNKGMNTTDVDDTGGAKSTSGKDTITQNDDISFEGLMSKLPLTTERLAASNTKIINALFENGETFQNKLENYTNAVSTYDELLRRFGLITFAQKEQALFNLYYCSNKLGLKQKADSAKTALNTNFGDGKMANKLREGNNTDTKKKDIVVTKKYEGIYALFIEGKFEEAKQEKAKADAQYGKNYWTPQLLFIESIYYVKQRNDDTAIAKLQSLSQLFPSSPLATKANNMIEVLRKRKDIETYLTNLQVERKQDTLTAIDTTSIQKPVDTKPVVKSNQFNFIATDSQYVALVLDKVDRIFVNEAKNAMNQYNRQKYYAQNISLDVVNINEQYNLLLIGPYDNAVNALTYIERTRPLLASQLLSWLAVDKYYFTIISKPNLDLLKQNKDVTRYHQLVKQALPNKF
jgi:hypothetical protein